METEVALGICILLIVLNRRRFFSFFNIETIPLCVATKLFVELMSLTNVRLNPFLNMFIVLLAATI